MEISKVDWLTGKNVREIAERNSGFCNITAEKDSFTADVYIPLLTERGKSL